MTAFNPFADAQAIQRFLKQFDAPSTSRGRTYFREGRVHSLGCLEPETLYKAEVEGGSVYEVELLFDDGEWDGHCTCPVEYECKHIYAATLAFQSRWHEVAPDGFVPADAPQACAVSKASAGRKQGRPAQQKLPDTPLFNTVAAAAGGSLSRGEIQFLNTVHDLHVRVAPNRSGVSGYELLPLSPGFSRFGWGQIELWPSPPKDDYEFWLYCAWFMRREGLAWPAFMEAATDLGIIEPAMREWERFKEVERWRNLFRAAPSILPAATPPVDLQLVLGAAGIQMRWRPSPEQPFAPLKQTQVRNLMRSHEQGELRLTQAAEAIWAALYKPYDYYSWTNLRYDGPETARLLNRLLRNPELHGHIVTPTGVPFRRPAVPLKLELLPAESADGDYALRYIQADGTVAPGLLAILPGHPTLYLTADSVFSGPPASTLTLANQVAIPAPALESAEGLGFLSALEVPLPARLAERTRTIAFTVKLYCDLKPEHPGSDREAVYLRAEAVAEGAATEKLDYNLWRPSDKAPARAAKKKTPAKDDIIPIYRRESLQHFPQIFERLGAKWDTYKSQWRIRLTKTFPDVFLPWLAALPPNIEVLLDRELATLRDNPVSGTVRLDVEESGVDWFDLKVVLNVSDTELTPEELKILLNAKGGYVRLGRKGWRRLQFNLTDEEDENLSRLGLDARDFTAEPQRLHAFQLADAAAKKFLPEQQVEKIHRRASELKARVNPPVPAGIRAELRPYQIEGFHFLAYLTANRFGGVLADDMGLGKTLQTLAWLAWLREQPLASSRVLQPSLVVCPKSVMDNWRAEAERFLPGLRVRLWRGEDADALTQARVESDLIVIHYPHLRALTPEITKLPWHAVILDEAQYIKNPDSQTAQSARALQAEHRLALSGTPIENRLLDLWSILAFAMPGVLGNRSQFTKKFNATDDPLARRRLASRVRPFLLRRTKNQVAKDLPDRIEEDLLCELEGEQKTLYRAEFKRAQQLLLKVKTKQDLNENRFNFLTSLLRLRQICCHPALVDNKLRESDSAKLAALVDLLEPLMEEGHKVLVFSQFVSLLDIVRETVKARDWPHFYLTGETDNRGDLVKEFQDTKGSAVFLISLKAGGFGLNLTAASYVVLFDPWWNPAVEAQAIDRTHRIGQKNKVIAYRLLMKSSIEEKIRALQKTKAALADDVLGEETFAKSLTLEDLKYLFAEE